MKKGFTLAEVLITLGIIGVVAALTMPALISNHRKTVVVTRLQKFYSIINQAVKLSEAENGPAEDWNYPVLRDNYQQEKEFYDTYLAKYILSLKVEECLYTNLPSLCVHFSDGSIMQMRHLGSGGWDVFFHVNEKELRHFQDTDITRGTFAFIFNRKSIALNNGKHSFFEPYIAGWDGTRSGLIRHATTMQGCADVGSYCAALIRYDGWQIKADYPPGKF
ncbi:MAG: type II secretion system GspH family protein [Heliobacteriaceae bacterium]|jgi:prepilin-type N-terminal cleavage/methylation domain-containing protein|nr:type II secretion system GspH family protein [Heliobacteriaceae bacterium]